MQHSNRITQWKESAQTFKIISTTQQHTYLWWAKWEHLCQQVVMVCNQGFNWFHFMTFVNTLKTTATFSWKKCPDHSVPALSLLRLWYLQCENENFTPCLFYQPHRRTPRCALLPLLELFQHSCPAHCRVSDLPGWDTSVSEASSISRAQHTKYQSV